MLLVLLVFVVVKLCVMYVVSLVWVMIVLLLVL